MSYKIIRVSLFPPEPTIIVLAKETHTARSNNIPRVLDKRVSATSSAIRLLTSRRLPPAPAVGISTRLDFDVNVRFHLDVSGVGVAGAAGPAAGALCGGPQLIVAVVGGQWPAACAANGRVRAWGAAGAAAVGGEDAGEALCHEWA